MPLPANISHIFAVIVSITFAVFTILNAQPEFKTWTWIGAALSVLAILKTIFTDSPKVAAQKAEAKRLGLTSIPVDPKAGVVS